MKRIFPVFALVLALAFPASGWAQILDMRLGADGPAFTYGRASGRLDAMGGMLIAVPDEAGELNMLDFGDNIAGLLRDRDSWSTDVWLRTVNRSDNTLLGRRLDIDNNEQGLMFVSRLRGETLALGGLVAHGEGDFAGSGQTGQSLSGTGVSVLYSQAFGSRLTLGGRFAAGGEDEKLRSSNVFAIRHSSSTTQLGGAAVFRALDWLDVGFSVDYLPSMIEGVAASPFHRDLYDWSRPTLQIGGQVIGRFENAAAGLVYRTSSTDGREEVEVNWADRFPFNPSNQNISWRGPTMKEEADLQTVLGRVEWLPMEGTTVAALVGFVDETNKVTKKSNFESSLAAVDSDAKSGLAVLGASRWFMDDRLLGAVEFRRERTSVDFVEPRWKYNWDSGRTEIAAGAEYFWTREVLLRGGALRSSRSQDQGVGTIKHAGYGVTLGVGYVPSGGLLQIDAGYRYLKETPDDASKSVAQQEGLGLGNLGVQAVTISARLLF